MPHWLVLWCHRCLSRPLFLWRELSCSHDLTPLSWSHSPRCWRSHVSTYHLSCTHLSGTTTGEAYRWLQEKFRCHQHLVVDDENFPLLFGVCIPGTSTRCYLRITGLHFLCLEKQHKEIEKPETVSRSAWAQGLNLICLLMAVQQDSEGLESHRLYVWKQPWTK